MSPWVRRVPRSQVKSSLVRLAVVLGVQALLVLLSLLPARATIASGDEQGDLGPFLALALVLAAAALALLLLRPARLLAAHALSQASNGSPLVDVMQRQISGIASTLIFLGVLIVTYRLILYRHLLDAVTGARGIEAPLSVGAGICGVLGLGNLLVHAVPLARRASRDPDDPERGAEEPPGPEA